MDETNWIPRPVERRDQGSWRRLFTDYCAFYGRDVTEGQLGQVWSKRPRWPDHRGLEVSRLVTALAPTGSPEAQAAIEVSPR